MIRAFAALALLFGLAAPVWLPLVMSSAQSPPTEPICVNPPPGIALHATNSQLIRDRAGVIWAATRAPSSIGGVVWRNDGGANCGVSTIVLQLGPQEFYGNGELVVWPDGWLYFITVRATSERVPTHIVAHPVPGFTP